MAYVSLYRKYRSQTFEDVMGQDHVTRTLQNAIRQGKVAHAYLFCGTRGTGKTTTARLLAKALNCEKGPTPQPCNECPACTSITSGSAMDIMELDAASHRGIGDVKDINDNVKFPPMELRYKVFIIDEAHQLSNDAKDAFLKTLEEPPAHAVFILATTEPQSIPITIRSRCQQFDFRRGSLRDIRERLKYVAEGEGVKADDAALDLMATSADGSWRDALSLLEQVLAYTDGQVTMDDVSTVLGMVTQDFLFRVADTLAGADEQGAFDAAAEVIESGRDIQQLLKSLAQHFRNLLFATVTKNLSDVTTNEQTASRLREQASRFSRRALLRMVEVFSAAEREVRHSDQHRLLLELALLKSIEVGHAPEHPAETPARPAAQPVPPKQSVQPRSETPAKPDVPAKPVRTAPNAAVQPPASDQQRLPEFDRIAEKWGQVLQHVRTIDVPTHALVTDFVPGDVRDGVLVLHFKPGHEGKARLLDEGKGSVNPKRKALAKAIEQVFGVANVRFCCEASKIRESPVPEASDSDDLPDPFQSNGQETLHNVLDLFNGQIVDE